MKSYSWKIFHQFIERQLGDSRYISKVVKSLFSNIVREENEQEAVSKKCHPCTGCTRSIKKGLGHQRCLE